MSTRKIAHRAAALPAALVVLIAWPVSAWATCAWVLWNDTSLIGWILIGAFPAYEQCERSLIAKARDFLRVTESDKSDPNVARVTTEQHGNIIIKTTHLKDGRAFEERHRLSCLPDTIDPRKPRR